MKFFSKAFLAISFFALIFFFINESFTYYMGLTNAKVTGYKKDKLILENLTAAQARNLQILAEILSVDKEVKKAYIEDNPEILKKHILPIWDRVRNAQLTYEIHFFKPPAISFVNFSNFKSIGKDVSDVRTDIEWVTSSFKESSHALMCKTYAGYRATHPIYDDRGNMLGGLSLGKKVDWIPEAIKNETKHNAFLVYEKNATTTLGEKYYKHFIHNKEIIGEYILADKTINIAPQEIKQIDFSKKIQSIVIKNENYTLYTFPIIDFNKNTMGYVCTVTQLEEFREQFFSNFTKNFIVVFIMALFIILITRKIILNLLKEIQSLDIITKNIKHREFLPLHSFKSQLTTEALITLESDIVAMGLELQRQYETLEKQVTQKTEDLNAQKYKLESMIGSFDKHVVYSTTDLNGIITHASEAFCELSEYTNEELMGHAHNILRHPDMSASIFEKLWIDLKQEKCVTVEIKNRKKYGGYYWVTSNFQPQYDSKGKHIGYISIRFDITTFKDEQEA